MTKQQGYRSASLWMMIYYHAAYVILCVQLLCATLSGVSCSESEGSGSGEPHFPVESENSNTRCIPLEAFVDADLIVVDCLRYFPDDKIFFYNYSTEFITLKELLIKWDEVLAFTVSPYCLDFARVYVCNHVYPGCNPTNGLPQGICSTECEQFFQNNTGCINTIESVFEVVEGFKPESSDQTIVGPRGECNNTVEPLTGVRNHDPLDCFNITELISRMEGTNTMLTRIVPIALAVVVVVLILSGVTGASLCVWKKKKSMYRKRKESNQMPQTSLKSSNRYHYPPELNGGDISQNQSLLGAQTVNWNNDSIHQKLLIRSVNLKVLESVGQGEFGVVYKGHLLKDLGQVVTGVVAIKTLKGFFDKKLVEDLLKECLKMQDFDHPNVLSLTGVCLDGGQTPFLVMPFMTNGSLLSYLRKQCQSFIASDDSSEETVSATLKQLTSMCFQVAKGMEYIASKRIIHRDLAARNCMIDMNFVIKVADFGLSEQLESKDYFRQDQQEAIKLPVKWLAPESLKQYVFSEKSDIWSFGVTCWEIFSAGQVPYVEIKPTELLTKLESGYRMEKPTNAACTDEIYDLVMLQCWKASPVDRPSFSNLVQNLAQMLESMADYLHIGVFDQELSLESDLTNVDGN